MLNLPVVVPTVVVVTDVGVSVVWLVTDVVDSDTVVADVALVLDCELVCTLLPVVEVGAATEEKDAINNILHKWLSLSKHRGPNPTTFLN